MLRLTLRQARSTAGRLLLAGVAVALGTGFVAAVLLTSALFTRTVTNAVAAQYTGADVVVRPNGGPLSDAQVAELAGVPGVGEVEGRVSASVEVVGARGTEYTSLRSTSTAPGLARLDESQLAAGQLPRAAGEVAVSASTADRLGVALGGTLTVRTYPPTPATDPTDPTAVAAPADGAAVGSTDAVTSSPAPVDVPVTVVGLLDDDLGPLLSSDTTVLAVASDAQTWSAGRFGDLPAGSATSGYDAALVVVAPGADPAAVRDAVAERLRGDGLVAHTGDWDMSQGWSGDTPPVDVLTVGQLVDRTVDDSLDGAGILTGAALAFAAVAVFVATTVITNTFSVVVAQRTRQLALLRCVGATRGQVRRSVLAEAAVLGLAASVAGVLAGTGLAAAAAAVLSRYAPGVPLPDGVLLTPVAVVVPLVVGTAATVLAALVPARAATRVSPLEAMRPAATPDLRTRTSRVRLGASLLLLVGGGGLLVLGTVVATGGLADAGDGLTGASSELVPYGVYAAVLGGMASFAGVLVGQVFLVPRAVSLVGRLTGRAGGAPARLAALNAVRNPRRTASTAGALLIGTTLVALMVVGAATTSRTLDAALDRQYPVDVEVSSVSTGSARYGPALPAAVVQGASSVAGLRASAQVLTAEVSVSPGDSTGATGAAAAGSVVGAAAAPLSSLEQVLADPSAVAGLQPGTVLVPVETAQQIGVTDGQTVTVRPTTTTTETSEDGTSTSGSTSTDTSHPGELLTARVSQVGGMSVLLDPADLRAVVPAAAPAALWMGLAPGADPLEVSGAVQSAVSEATGADPSVGPVSVSGLAAERAQFSRVIDTMLLVVVGLLAVAVVIALVGVANTLSLSVIERTRENAVLRALGLTRGQLRRMLAVEGALVAGVGGLLGVVLGSVYGWAGAASLLGGAAAAGGDAIWTPSLPWARLGLLLAVAVVAGLLASVLPARRAVRTPPVAALADQ